jgi:hypothetical protein
MIIKFVLDPSRGKGAALGRAFYLKLALTLTNKWTAIAVIRAKL